ncbi:class I SAM-dependent methyltransferase [Streptomyces sp. NPDC091377]|uniref:class I SAM-dependent methyltransferase n=1 Tax=Streptomyces sp. NPDC091377 TaxID=3365995 RepID=UPI00382ED322
MTDAPHRAPAAVTFDAIGAAYQEAFAASEPHRRSLAWLLDRLAPGSRVLDVGSGTGRPTAETLVAAGHEVHGLDISPVMVDLATRQVPGATFECADAREVSLPQGRFDAVCSYFAMLQMDRSEQTDLVRRMATAVRPSGHVVLATVALEVEDVEVEFLGQPVRATSFSTEGFVELAASAGLVVLDRQEVLFTPALPEAGPEPQLFLYCRREG